MKEDEVALSHIDNQSVYYKQLVNAIVGKQLTKLVVVETKIELACQDNHVMDEERKVRRYGNNEMENAAISF